jgi:transcriptional regulator with XRE-family HTH domain
MTLAERLEAFIDATTLKNKEFAEILQMKSSQLQKYLAGTSPSSETLEKLARAGCNVHWLVTGEGGMYAENEAGRALQANSNAYNPERDDNVGEVLDGRLLMQTRVYTNAITDDDVKNLESLTKKLRSLV